MSIPLISDYIDGYVAAHTAIVFPEVTNRPTDGPGSYFPVGLEQSMCSFQWWRVKAWRLHLEYSGSKIYSGTASGLPWSYTETYSGTLDDTFDLSVSTDLNPNSTAFQGAASSVGTNAFAIFEKRFSKRMLGCVFSYAWDFAPPPGAPTLPSGFTDNEFHDYEIFVPRGVISASVAESGGSWHPEIQLLIPRMGSSLDSVSSPLVVSMELEFQDAGGSSLGDISIYRDASDLPVSATGYLAIDSLWDP